jgi:hypothetical protein
MSWELGNTVVNRLTKPPLNDHSCRNLERTDAYSSGVRAVESSPYKVKRDKALIFQGRVVVEVGSSFGREPVIPSPRTRGPSDTFTGFLNWQGGFVVVALRVTLLLLSKQ